MTHVCRSPAAQFAAQLAAHYEALSGRTQLEEEVPLAALVQSGGVLKSAVLCRVLMFGRPAMTWIGGVDVIRLVVSLRVIAAREGDRSRTGSAGFVCCVASSIFRACCMLRRVCIREICPPWSAGDVGFGGGVCVVRVNGLRSISRVC